MKLTGGTSLGGGATSYTGDDIMGGTSYKEGDTGIFIAPDGCWAICADPVWDPTLCGPATEYGGAETGMFIEPDGCWVI